MTVSYRDGVRRTETNNINISPFSHPLSTVIRGRVATSTEKEKQMRRGEKGEMC